VHLQPHRNKAGQHEAVDIVINKRQQRRLSWCLQSPNKESQSYCTGWCNSSL
jgi:hypothetical protein